jgi:hypothetical protein
MRAFVFAWSLLLALLAPGAAGALTTGEPSAAPPPAEATPPAPPPAVAPPDAPAPGCDVATGDRPPDPRCGETLDGRPTAEPPPNLAVPRAVLWGPRLASRVVFWPVVKTSDAVEYYQVLPWLRALLTTDDGLVGVRPEITYATSFIPTGGLRLFYRRLPENAQVTARFLTGGPSVMLGQLQVQGPAWLGLVMTGTFNRRDDRLFAGIGPNNRDDLAAQGHGKARYGSDIASGELRWSHRLPARLVAGLHADLQRREYQATDVRAGPSVADLFGLPPDACAAAGLPAPCVDPAQMPGFTRGLRIVHGGGNLMLDLRGRTRDASGFSVALGSTYAQGVAGDPSRHALFTGEAVAAVGGHDRQLLVRGWAATLKPLGSAPIPFDELISPSGSLGMRGFPEGRFRGESGLVGTAEYRWFIAFDLDASLFTDVGTVADRNFSNIRWDRWFPSVGAGLRIYKPAGPYWDTLPATGVQIAYSLDGGFRLLLSLAAF